MDLALGRKVIGKYRIDGIVGRGDLGVVYAAFHPQREQRVAIKVMRTEAVERQGGVLRFVRDARAAARLTSDHGTRIYDVGTLENGQPFVAMEFLEGLDVAAAVAARGRFSHESAVRFVLQACDALAEAHAVGIVHRDLDPTNLFLVRRADGTEAIKVLNLGISKLSRLVGERSDDGVALASSVASALHLSPEQLRSSRDVDLRTDIWSLGVVLYLMLSGRAPFTGTTWQTVHENVRSATIEPPSVLARGVPPALDRIVLRCLERPLEQRYQSVADLAHALAPLADASVRAWVDGSSRLAELEPGFVTPPSLTSQEHTSDAPWVGRSPLASDTRPGSRKWLWFAIAALLGAPCGYVLSHRRASVHGEPSPRAAVPLGHAAQDASEVPRGPSAASEPARAVIASGAKLIGEPPPRPKAPGKDPNKESRGAGPSVSAEPLPSSSASGGAVRRESASSPPKPSSSDKARDPG